MLVRHLPLLRPAVLAQAAALGVCTLSLTTPAHAGSFDDDGEWHVEPQAIWHTSFEADEPAIEQVPLAAAPSSALDGARYGHVEGAEAIELPLPLPGGGEFVFKAFARGNRLVGAIRVAYAPIDGERGTPSFDATLYPTGLVTSDGWYEVASAPIRVDGARAATVSAQLYGSGVDLDALEWLQLGSQAPAVTACDQAQDARCDADQYCMSGFCRDGAVTVPSAPEGDARRELAAYLASRLQRFFGGKYTREQHLPDALARLDAAAASSGRWAFWSGFAHAVHLLHDWHTSIQGPVDRGGRGVLPVCFVEGRADASHGVAPADAELADVLISHGSADLVASSGLAAGDRLVAVDGVHPLRWMQQLAGVDWSYWRATDPSVHAEAAERLPSAIRRFAKEISVVRCSRENHTCADAVETLPIAELPTQMEGRGPSCDHRPLYPIDGLDDEMHRVGSARAGALRHTSEEEQLRGMVWNSVYAVSGNPYASVFESLRGARGVLLDHRTGNGGTEYAAELLTRPFRERAVIGAATAFLLDPSLFDEPFDGLSLFNARKDSDDGFLVGSTDFDPNRKTALLLARDGSASDWFPAGMQGAANVRLFGRTTAGAFSSFFQFDYYGQLGWQFASGDYIGSDGVARIGHGVRPDEDLVPLQSDLLRGRDTVVERALAWLREP